MAEGEADKFYETLKSQRTSNFVWHFVPLFGDIEIISLWLSVTLKFELSGAYEVG